MAYMYQQPQFQPPLFDQNYLMQLFRGADRDGSGVISANELQGLLSHGSWSQFNLQTVNMMIGMFDRDGSNTINFDEFCSLWKYIEDWQRCFRSYDRDNSGSIDRNELRMTLTSFGYNFSDRFYDMIPRFTGKDMYGKVMFDDFISLCIKLHTLTQAFRRHDMSGTGMASLRYEDFMTSILELKL